MNPAKWAHQLQAIAQNGLAFSKDDYDRERYEQLQKIAASLLSEKMKMTPQEVRELWRHEEGYATPKVDVRGAMFQDGKVLLVRERSDGKWTLPGGWADINDSPSEAVVREVFEESGYRAKAVKLAAVYDRNRHPHPPMLYHVYKLFFICEMVGGQAAFSHETDGVDFFRLHELPELSLARVTAGQIARLFEHDQKRELATDFD